MYSCLLFKDYFVFYVVYFSLSLSDSDFKATLCVNKTHFIISIVCSLVNIIGMIMVYIFQNTHKNTDIKNNDNKMWDRWNRNSDNTIAKNRMLIFNIITTSLNILLVLFFALMYHHLNIEFAISDCNIFIILTITLLCSTIITTITCLKLKKK